MNYLNEVHDSLSSTHTERPRKRILALGAERLSDFELFSLLIGSGIRGNSVDQIAHRLLELLTRVIAA